MISSFISPFYAARPHQAEGERRTSALRTTIVILLLWLVTGVSSVVHAQTDPTGDPTGSSGDINGLVTTAGSYDAYTANAKREITDLVVPGSNGTYPLAFSRISNSRTYDVPGDLYCFGDDLHGCGNWRHSYQWVIWQSVPPPPAAQVTTWTVAYPDGRVINFTMGGGDSPPNDPYARGPIGTSDQLYTAYAGSGSNGSITLLQSDGGQVVFRVFNGTGTVNNTFRPITIVDPYGAITSLGYSCTPDGKTYWLSGVVEPGGRRLNFNYNTISYTDSNSKTHSWFVLTSIDACNAQNAVEQTVSYSYSSDITQSPLNKNVQPVQDGSTWYLPLYAVVYPETSTAGGQVAARYTYNYGDGSGGEPPILATCDDPHYAGPMSRIKYSLNNTQQSYWGIIQYEANYPRPGVGDQNVYAVSNLGQDQFNTPNVSTETRPDGANRKFKYGEGTVNNIPTSAKGFQPTTVTDFESNTTCIYYNTQASQCGRGFMFQTTDPNGNSTRYATERYTGKPMKVTLPDGRSRRTVWASRDGSQATPTLDASAIPSTQPTSPSACTQPYYIIQTIDEHGLATNYKRTTSFSDPVHPAGGIYEVDYPDNSTETYTYQKFTGPQAAGYGVYYKVSSHTTRLGAVISYTYDANHGGSGGSDLLTGVTRTYTDANNVQQTETTTFYYDSWDRVNKVVDPGNVTDTYAYNNRHQLLQTTHSADGTHVLNGYDDYGRRTSVQDELGHVASTVYDDYGRPTSVTRPVYAYGISSVATQFTYDRRNDSNQVLCPAMAHTAGGYSYMILPTGRGEQHIYTPNNWPKEDFVGTTNGSVTNPDFTACIEESSVTHDAVGQVLQITDAQNHVWTNTYDSCHRLITSQDPLSTQLGDAHTTTWNYYQPNQQVANGVDYAGWLQSVTTPGPDLKDFPTSTTTYNNYDVNGHATSVTVPYQGGSTTHTYASTYNAAGGLTNQGDGANTTSYKYDQLGRKKKIGYPDNTTSEQWTYYPGGMVKTYTNRAGTMCTYQYDGRNRLKRYDWSDGSTPWVAYTFDAASHLLEVQNPSADIQYTPDQSGQVSAESELIGGQSAGLSTTYTRDVDGDIYVIQYPNGNTPSFSFDYQGRYAGMYLGNVTCSQYNYTGDWLTGSWLRNGIYTSYGHQNNGRVTDVWHYHGNSSGTPASSVSNVSRHAYGYAPDGKISWFDRESDLESDGVTHQSGSSLENGRGDVFLYWGDGTLGAADRDYANPQGWPNAFQPMGDARVDPASLSASGGTSTYSNGYYYDTAGNRTQVTQLSPSENLNYGTANSDNQYSWSSYGGNGNTTNSAMGWTYAYDAEGKMTSASQQSGGGFVSFSY